MRDLKCQHSSRPCTSPGIPLPLISKIDHFLFDLLILSRTHISEGCVHVLELAMVFCIDDCFAL